MTKDDYLFCVYLIPMFIPDNILCRFYDLTISVLANWEAHTSSTEDEATSCEEYGDNCPFMGKMPGLVKISLGSSGGNDNKDDTEKDENEEFNDADLEAQSDGVNETENGAESDRLLPGNDANDDASWWKYCCFF